MGERRERRWSLQGMTALVTGGTKGIGSVTSCFMLPIHVGVQIFHISPCVRKENESPNA